MVPPAIELVAAIMAMAKALSPPPPVRKEARLSVETFLDWSLT